MPAALGSADVMRHVSIDTRRAMIGGLIPRTLILMPTLSAITSTSGWFLAVQGTMQVAHHIGHGALRHGF